MLSINMLHDNVKFMNSINRPQYFNFYLFTICEYIITEKYIG